VGLSDLLEIRGLGKRFGRRTVLENLDLNLPGGMVYGLLGKNGEGKTTLMRLVMGIVPPDGGSIRFDGRRISYREAGYKKAVFLIAEDPVFYEWMTVREFLRLNSAFYPAWQPKKAGRLLDRFGLPGKTRIRNMSRGMKLKLGMVAALAAEPRLLLLDDPTSGLDLPTRRDFLENLVSEILESGTSLLFATHMVHELEGLTGRIGILEGGRLLVEEATETLQKQVRRIRVSGRPEDLAGYPMESALTVSRKPGELEAVIWPRTERSLEKLDFDPACSLIVEELSLEDIFLAFTRRSRSGGGGSR
jgi:ABC-2 type transport system ATP-binding protein